MAEQLGQIVKYLGMNIWISHYLTNSIGWDIGIFVKTVLTNFSESVNTFAGKIPIERRIFIQDKLGNNKNFKNN